VTKALSAVMAMKALSTVMVMKVLSTAMVMEVLSTVMVMEILSKDYNESTVDSDGVTVLSTVIINLKERELK
jgi:hypothetical protein